MLGVLSSSKSKFSTWLANWMAKESLSTYRVAEMTGNQITHAAIVQLRNGRRNPGYKSCVALAQASGEDLEFLLKLAGLRKN